MGMGFSITFMFNLEIISLEKRFLGLTSAYTSKRVFNFKNNRTTWRKSNMLCTEEATPERLYSISVMFPNKQV